MRFTKNLYCFNCELIVYSRYSNRIYALNKRKVEKKIDESLAVKLKTLNEDNENMKRMIEERRLVLQNFISVDGTVKAENSDPKTTPFSLISNTFPIQFHTISQYNTIQNSQEEEQELSISTTNTTESNDICFDCKNLLIFNKSI